MADEIVGSHEKSENAFGQNGYQGPRKLGGGEPKTKANIPNVSPPTPDLVAARGIDDQNWQTRTLKGGNANPDNVPNHRAMPERTVSSGSPGGTVPSKLSYGREGKR